MSDLTSRTRLDRPRRGRDLQELAHDTVDLLVVGGGITGVGVALDAASRGLSVALVEKHDLAFGTSRWSSKLVHGGLRYLARGQFGIAYESARERHVLLTKTAPHLVRPLRFVVPLLEDIGPFGAVFAQAGLLVGDVLRMTTRTPGRLLPAARRVSLTAARGFFPALRDVRGALVHWDGQLDDDAHLVVAVARTAAAYNARILTHCAAVRVDAGGALLSDELSGESLQVRARQVVVATGVWAPELVPQVRLRPSRGTHVVLRADALEAPRSALTVLVPGTTNRWVFAMPRHDGTMLVGLTDDPVDAVEDVPSPGPDDVDFLLGVLNRALRTEVTASDVLSVFAGLRPLLAADEGATADLSRRHALIDNDGVLTVVGGKLTTYRAMAQDAVDLACRRLGVDVACRTDSLPLVGAATRPALSRLHAPQRLLSRYGAEAPAVTALADGRPELLQPVAEGSPVLGVELLFGAAYEGALTTEDLLDRRTRLGLVPEWRAAAEALAGDLVAAASI